MSAPQHEESTMQSVEEAAGAPLAGSGATTAALDDGGGRG